MGQENDLDGMYKVPGEEPSEEGLKYVHGLDQEHIAKMLWEGVDPVALAEAWDRILREVGEENVSQVPQDTTPSVE